MERSIDRFTLKCLAYGTMLIDHLGYAFFPDLLILRMIGRISFPLFAFMISEGYRYTSDKNRYTLRLFIWALFSQIPFSLMVNSPITTAADLVTNINVIFTLLFGLLSIRAQSLPQSPLRVLVPLGLSIIAYYLHFDYSFFGVLLVLAFYYAKGDDNKMILALLGLSLFNRFVSFIYASFVIETWNLVMLLQCLAIIPILLYNEKSGSNNQALKAVFYLFYPVHLLIIGLILQFS